MHLLLLLLHQILLHCMFHLHSVFYTVPLSVSVLHSRRYLLLLYKHPPAEVYLLLSMPAHLHKSPHLLQHLHFSRPGSDNRKMLPLCCLHLQKSDFCLLWQKQLHRSSPAWYLLHKILNKLMWLFHTVFRPEQSVHLLLLRKHLLFRSVYILLPAALTRDISLLLL